MRLAAEALQERLRALLLTDASGRGEYYEDRLRFVGEIVELADPDDIFEQDAFRRSFTTEFTELPEP